MQRSSESIGAIASALAKAQSGVANPEKSLVAHTVPVPRKRTGPSAVRRSRAGRTACSHPDLSESHS
jgi:hypothetical protein